MNTVYNILMPKPLITSDSNCPLCGESMEDIEGTMFCEECGIWRNYDD